MTRAAIVALVILAALPLAGADKKPSDMDKALAQIEASKSPDEAMPPMRFILAHATEAPAMQLFLASAVALNTQNVEDAAFLFYAGQMRMRYDFARFPSKGTGGDSPAAALGAISQQLGAEVNPAIMREPALFAKAVARVQAWSPANAAGYDPGWEYTGVKDADAKQQFAEHRDGFVKQMGGLSTLLNDPEYFAAFKILQDYNFSPYEEEQKPDRLKAKDAAVAKMSAIEARRGIEGLFYKKSK